jgi:hypothetical protein
LARVVIHSTIKTRFAIGDSYLHKIYFNDSLNTEIIDYNPHNEFIPYNNDEKHPNFYSYAHHNLAIAKIIPFDYIKLKDKISFGCLWGI